MSKTIDLWMAVCAFIGVVAMLYKGNLWAAFYAGMWVLAQLELYSKG